MNESQPASFDFERGRATIERRIRFRPRKPAEPLPTAEPMDIVERDDGKFSIGFHDDCAGPFETRRHARDARLRRYSRHSDQWLR